MTLRKGPESQIDHAERLKMAEDGRMLLESLFYKGYEYEEILYMLKNQHNITISLSTLKGSWGSIAFTEMEWSSISRH